MPNAAIQLHNLTKTYTIHERESGTFAAIRSLYKRKTRDVHAVNAISFEIEEGEIVGFLGPNGAGKTTTLKMLSGLLHPTSGSADVLGFQPYNRDHAYLKQMALIMGQRNQLVWDIPANDTYEVNRVIYDIPKAQFQKTLDELVELLELKELIKKPVRNLSLGERMKCEIAGVLLHRPKIVFLDEPTIGLDVSAQRIIRDFIREYNRRYHATIMLTSHYMADVEALCERVIIIHRGKLLFDGALATLISQFAATKTIAVEFAQPVNASLAQFGDVMTQSDLQATLRIPKRDAPNIAGQLLNAFPVSDLTIQDPPIEEVIERVFNKESERADLQLKSVNGSA
jgi:ABC-2 type transport system ATP-binding protein